MALSRELNDRLTQVGPGTPGGDLFRRYWLPLCPASEVTEQRPRKRIRLLGENLVLFRDGSGRFGLVPETCPHRKASLYFGFIEADGLRCPYHGWKFDVEGACIDQPFEPPESKLRALARRPPYQVEQLAGILFGYIGPSPAPLLPRWEFLVRRDGTRAITVLSVHNCNWLQIQENSVDPVHTYYLHAQMLKREGYGPEYAAQVEYFGRPIKSFDFTLCQEPTWTGIRKVRVHGGPNPERETGHPMIFPNMLISPQGKEYATIWRVPVDDHNTYQLWLLFTPTADGSTVEQSDTEIPVSYCPHPRRPDGDYDLSLFQHHDQMAAETQGATVDRSDELLGTSDRGVTMYRRLLHDQIDLVRSGGEPAGVIRDRALNEMISFSISDGLEHLSRKLEATR